MDFFKHQELLKNEYYKSNLSHFLFKMESVNAFTYTSTIEKNPTKYYLFPPLSLASFKDIVLNFTLLYFFEFFFNALFCIVFYFYYKLDM